MMHVAQITAVYNPGMQKFFDHDNHSEIPIVYKRRHMHTVLNLIVLIVM